MIQSLLRALEILEVLKGPGGSFTIAELSEAVSLPPSTVHRILQTLCAKRFVVRDERSHTYYLGPALISLGMTAAHHLRLQDAARPVLSDLSKRTGEDAFLIIPAGYKGLLLEKVDGPNNLKIVERYGYELDMHRGAIRKVLLAYQTPDFIRSYIEYLKTHSSYFTSTDAEKLQEELRKIHLSGIAVSQGEYTDNAFGVGAPVFDVSGTIKASIGVVVPAIRIPGAQRLEALKQSVSLCARELSELMGYYSPQGAQL